MYFTLFEVSHSTINVPYVLIGFLGYVAVSLPNQINSALLTYHGISIDSIIGCVGGRLNIALINIGIIASSIEEYSQILGLVELLLNIAS